MKKASAIRRMRDRLRNFVAARRSNVAIMFALTLLPLILVVGAGVDYTVATRARVKLNALADAAVIIAVNKAAMSMTANAAQTNATNMFPSQVPSISPVTLGKVVITVTDTGTSRTAAVSYQATTPTFFMGVMGVKTINISGTASGASATPTYLNFYLLLDNSPSMGVGATAGDINTMVNNTPDQCAFACHDLSDPNNYYDLAKQLGVTMRIDVLRTATQQLMDTASATQIVSSQFRMAIYTFGSSASNAGLTTISALSSNLSNAKSAAATIDLMTVPYQNYNSDTQTNFDSLFTNINNPNDSHGIPTPGDGSSSSKPQSILFFVSDGVADEVNSSSCTQPTTNGQGPQTGKTYVRCQEPLNVSLCTAIKNRGIRIAVLYTTYLALPTNAWYNTWIGPFSSNIATNMQNCASPGLYFQVSPTQGISEAMNALFQKVVAEAHLTQ